MNFKFRLTDLMFWTACFAVSAWLISIGIWIGGFVWIGSVFGFEIGKRSDYLTGLLTLCGSVLGLALWLATFVTISTYRFFHEFNFQSLVLIAVSSAIPWILSIAIFFWLGTRLSASPKTDSTTDRR